MMHWFWWVVIVFAAICVLNKVCEEYPAFRQVFCCVIAVAYPILMFVFPEKEMVILFSGALMLGFYKYVFGMAEILEEEGPPDLFIFFWGLSDGETSAITIIFSVISTVLFAAVAIVPIALLTDVSLFLARVWTFAPAVYCIVTSVLYFRNNY